MPVKTFVEHTPAGLDEVVNAWEKRMMAQGLYQRKKIHFHVSPDDDLYVLIEYVSYDPNQMKGLDHDH